ncbi:hypothetical protein MTP99_008738 [Tenebrio molitor]|nr:hypothetical protein MTP99_008738 [Tenebrio molitor]
MGPGVRTVMYRLQVHEYGSETSRNVANLRSPQIEASQRIIFEMVERPVLESREAAARCKVPSRLECVNYGRGRKRTTKVKS